MHKLITFFISSLAQESYIIIRLLATSLICWVFLINFQFNLSEVMLAQSSFALLIVITFVVVLCGISAYILLSCIQYSLSIKHLGWRRLNLTGAIIGEIFTLLIYFSRCTFTNTIDKLTEYFCIAIIGIAAGIISMYILFILIKWINEGFKKSV